MEIIIICILGFGAYRLYRFVTVRMGLEAVRAYMYLEMRHEGVTLQEANWAIQKATSDPNPETMNYATAMAALAYHYVHDGKQLPVIGYAYRKGLQSTMPFLYRAGVLAVPRTLSLDAVYGELNEANRAHNVAGETCALQAGFINQEYYAEFLSILKTYFNEGVDIELYVNVLRTDKIRKGYEGWVPPAVIAQEYRDVLADSMLKNEVRQ